MSHQHGTYLGGIRTVEDLRSRCRVDDCTGCWHWSLAINQGSPRVHFVTPDDGRWVVTMRGRRAALYLARGRALPEGHVAFARTCCPSDDCVNPEHARSGTVAQQREALVRSGKLRNRPERRATNRGIVHRYLVKLTMAQAREIRASDEPHRVLAKRYGVSQFAIWSVKAGKTWLEQHSGASVFCAAALLTAANDSSKVAA